MYFLRRGVPKRSSRATCCVPTRCAAEWAWRGGRKSAPRSRPAAISRNQGYRVPKGRSTRRRTCSAHVTPAMPPPTTTNVPDGRAASMVPGELAADCTLVKVPAIFYLEETLPAGSLPAPGRLTLATGARKLTLSPYEHFPCVLRLKIWREAAFPAVTTPTS